MEGLLPQEFFKDRSLLCLIDALARRYGKTPYEVMTQMTINEFNMNIAIMAVANLEEEKSLNKIGLITHKSDNDFSRFRGFKRIIAKRN